MACVFSVTIIKCLLHTEIIQTVEATSNKIIRGRRYAVNGRNTVKYTHVQFVKSTIFYHNDDDFIITVYDNM